MSRSKRVENLIGWRCAVAMCVGLAFVGFGQRVLGSVLRVAAGIGVGPVVPPADSAAGDSHGASDTN